jgi:CHASE2 domain-containing sensor protein
MFGTWIESLGYRLWHSVWQPVMAWLMLLLAGYWLIFSDPYGLGEVSDQASENTIYRLIANWYNTDPGSENIVVVLFNDRSIDNLYGGFNQANDWPLSYQDQVYLLNTLMAQKPAAVFYDVMWMKQRAMDPSFTRAMQSLRLNQQATQVPLLLAAGTTQNLKESPVLGSISDFSTGVINAWEDAGLGYPLVSDEQPSAAMALYQYYCQSHGCAAKLGEFADPMSVRWSNYTAVTPLHRQQQCVPAPQSFFAASQALIWDVIRGAIKQDWMDDDPAPKCMPHTLLFADEVVAMARSDDASLRDQLTQQLQHKLVLIGGQIEGVYDYAYSPVHGAVPGVFMHAMALDNLLTTGTDYLRDSEMGAWWILLSWAVFALFLVSLYSPRWQARQWHNWRQHYRLIGISYALVVTLLSMTVWHLAPSGWISLLALGWVGQGVLQNMSARFASPGGSHE